MLFSDMKAIPCNDFFALRRRLSELGTYEMCILRGKNLRNAPMRSGRCVDFVVDEGVRSAE